MSPIILEELLALCREAGVEAVAPLFEKYGSGHFFGTFDPTFGIIENTDLRQLLTRYTDKQTGGQIPEWTEDIPFELKEFLPNLHVLDFVAHRQMRYRVFGTAVARYYGQDFTGKVLPDCEPSVRVIFHALAILVAERPSMLYTQHAPPDNSKVFDCQRLYLPFGDADGSVCRVLVGQYPYRRQAADNHLQAEFRIEHSQ